MFHLCWKDGLNVALLEIGIKLIGNFHILSPPLFVNLPLAKRKEKTKTLSRQWYLVLLCWVV
jgi:hypothetical protein